ncbi:MAG: sensor histidine kinase, partial [Rhizomicrobium sp.]
AELMLKGLRVLLSPSTAAKRLEDLTALMVEAIAGAAHVVLDVERNGRIRALIPASRPVGGEILASLCQSPTAPVSCHKEHDPQTPALRALLGLHSGEVALIHLPLASQNVVLVCASRREDGFRSEDIGLASRFALILRQALMLKEEQDKLVQAARLSVLGQMSASLAHELRQPLNTISVAAQNLELMAAAGPILPETLSAKIERIRGQVDRAAHIMDRIRRFSRRNSEDFALVDVVPLVEGVRVLLGPDLIAAGILLKVEIPEPMMLRCDAIQIEQVLTNLVRNAMDALNGIGSAARTPNGVITIRGMRANGGILLRVEDNGPGFPADVAARPLETFYTSKGAEAGTGLGLSICHMIAREHAGSLTIGNHASGGFVELRLPERSGI